MGIARAAFIATCFLLGCAAQASAAPAQPRAQRRPCELPGIAIAYCGAVEVPEDAERPDGRRLSIRFAVLPATQGPARADPIVPLLGGPGEAAIDAAAVFAERFAALREERDILLVDMRGTGRSAPLDCDLHAGADASTRLRHLLPSDGVRACARVMRSRADLSHYAYADVARDLEQVRRTLGYGPLNLSGGSYGTRAALVFARQHPDSVRTVYLGSVVPLDVPTPLTMARSAQAQFDRVLRDCAADAECRVAYPRLDREFAAIIARLDAGEVRVVPPGGGSEVTLSRGRVAEWFRARLYRPADGADLPWLVHQAHAGNWTPIVEGILDNAAGMARALSVGFWLTMTCREDVAFIDRDDIAPATRDTFLGDYRVREQIAACAHWPTTALPEGYRTPVRSPVPTLIVSGEHDAASPPWFTARVAPGLVNRAEIVSRHQGHTEWSPCVARAYARLVRDGSTANIAERVCEDTPAPALK